METRKVPHQAEATDERQEFYARLQKKNTAPLWDILAKLFPMEPRPSCVPVALEL